MPFPPITLNPSLVTVAGYVWLQDVGEEDFVGSAYAGTRGQSRRMEGFQLELVDPPGTLGLTYRAQVENLGWMDWVGGGTYIGTKGQGLRCEAFEIQLTGESSNGIAYSVEYMAHQQDFGDIGIFYDGAMCGSVGASLRLEGMAVSVIDSLGVIQQP